MNNIEPVDGLVSIIMPTYDSEKYVIFSLESVLNQTYENWELLVTDDVSGDSTIAVLQERAEKDHRIKIFVLPENSGAAVARNNSILKARGQFVAFLDSDDLWFSEKLERQVSFMNRENVSLSYTAYEVVDEYGEKSTSECKDLDERKSVSYDDMLKKKSIMGCLTVMFRREDFKSYEMPLIRQGQDYALWLKLLKTGKSAYKLNEVLAQYRIVPSSISRNKFRKAVRQFQIYRQIEGLSFVYSVECFIHYTLRAILPNRIIKKIFND